SINFDCTNFHGHCS
ncbi:unnamed protein product, partial [Allacma fusca]